MPSSSLGIQRNEVGISDRSDIVIRSAVPSDAHAWQALRCELWPDGAHDHANEIAMFFAGTLSEPVAVLIAEKDGGIMVAFAELSIRTHLSGFEGEAVGYLEGLYVVPEFRHQGIARKLLQASRSWARLQSCTAFASDRAERIVIDRSF
jgi:aminoglycoside 6'-N-acetyltransferase I